MKRQEIKKLILVIFMCGFLAGILYVNMIARSYIVSMGILSDYFLEQFAENNLNTWEYMWYLLKLRVIPVILLLMLWTLRVKRIAAACLLLWTGFSSGLFLTAAVLKLGLKGILLCMIGILPHFICYIVVYGIILIYIFTYPDTRWNQTKSVCMVLFLLLGIISEYYVNPVLINIFIKAF